MKKQKTIAKANVNALKKAIAKEQALIAVLEEERASQLQLEALVQKRKALHKKAYGNETWGLTPALIFAANLSACDVKIGTIKLSPDSSSETQFALETKRESSEMEKAPETKPSQDINSMFEPDRIEDQQDFCDMLSI